MALVVLETAAATLLALLVLRAHRRRQVSAARAAHPGATVVLASMVDLGSMRLAQWSAATGASLPFVTGAVVVVADADGLALARADVPGEPVHRWVWREVELFSQTHAVRDVLVLSLRGPPPAPRARRVPVERRRFDVTLAVRDITLTALTAATTAAAVRDAVASLSSRRRGTPDTCAGSGTTVERRP